MDPLPSMNPDWGFHGTMGRYAAEAWPLAFQMIAERSELADQPQAVRLFLDSTNGRYLADDVRAAIEHGDPVPKAIEEAVRQWMQWTVTRMTAMRHGLPHGWPLLKAWVHYYSLQGR